MGEHPGGGILEEERAAGEAGKWVSIESVDSPFCWFRGKRPQQTPALPHTGCGQVGLSFPRRAVPGGQALTPPGWLRRLGSDGLSKKG